MLSRWGRLRRRYKLLSVAAVLLTLSGGFLYFWLFDGLPSIGRLEQGLALPSTRIFDRQGRLLYEILPPEQGRNVVIPLGDIPDHCIHAVISVEDANYYNHIGVDIVGVARALWINLQGGEVLAGGSTITQQLVRMVLFDTEQAAERTLQRKLKEMILAVQLQSRYSKDEVLGLYLNQTYFGNLAYGIEGAARVYFGKSAVNLSLSECALLAGIIQNAALHDPLSNFESAQARQHIALDLMVQNGYITVIQAETAKRDDLQFASTPFPIEAPHFVMAVWKQLERDYPDQLYRQGLDVTTTVDLDWQRAAQVIVQRHLNYLNHSPDRIPANANNAALVAMDPFNGQVLTMLGSPDYFDESIDGAVNAALALRQPGSALKPFTYAAGMDPQRENPFTAASMLLDIRTGFVTRKLESYVPGNYGLQEHGVVLAREALASSYNIPAVLVLDAIGISPMIELAANAGLVTLATNPNLDLAVTLGGGEVRLLDLVRAYSIFPNGGFRVDPALILEVKVRDGQTLFTWRPPDTLSRVLDERVAYLINDILSDPEARRKEFGVPSPLDIGRPAAAKTGTTTDYRDNWVAGYTPNLVVGVWVGNANNSVMVDVSGISGAGPIWNDFMRTALQGQPELRFTRPAGLVDVEICALSGLLPTNYCPERRIETFIEGTQPTRYDNLYQPVMIDIATGLPATDATPIERRREQIFVALPPEARAWGHENGLRLLPDPVTMTGAPTTDDGLRITSPPPYSVYQLAPNRPPETQRIRLAVAAPAATRRVTYQLNGQNIAESRTYPFEAWWQLDVGEYQLTAIIENRDGSTQTSAPIPFSVVDYQDPNERAAQQNPP